MKVFDFGLAKSLFPHLRDEDGMYRLTGRTGSYPYMAPEIAKMSTYDEKCDVFSFGIVFWELLSLKKPFPRLRTQNEFLKKVAIKGSRPPIPRLSFNNDIIQEILTQSWKASPKDRPSVTEVRSMLLLALKILKTDDNLELRSHILREKSRRSIHQSLLKSMAPSPFHN